MRVYYQDDELIERWQWNDPALRNLTDVILGLLRGQRGRVLDLGCGSGRVAAALARAGFQVDGIDVSERAIAIGRRIMADYGLAVDLQAGDAMQPGLPVGDRDYDIVVCCEVLEHVHDWRRLLGRAGELLKPGGLLVLSVPRDPHQFSVLDEYAGHLRRFRDRELLDALQLDYHSPVVRRLGWPSMRLFVWAYSRLLRLAHRSHADESQALWREPCLARRLATGSFYWLLKIDNLFASLAFGTTLVVCARKRIGMIS